MSAPELDRIRAAYRDRDRRGTGRRSGPAAVAHQHELEWQLLQALRAARVDLTAAEVLDVGSGGGTLLHRLAELGAVDPTGVELVPERVEAARTRYPGLDIRCASATELPFDDGRFDVVTQFTVLSSVLDEDVRRQIVREVQRVLRPGGVFVSYDVRPSPRPLRVARRLWRREAPDAETPIRPLAEEDLERLAGRPERIRAVQLNLDLAELVGGHRAAVVALRSLRPLRSHLLATFRKA